MRLQEDRPYLMVTVNVRMATDCLTVDLSVAGLPEALALVEVSVVAAAEAAADSDSGGKLRLTK